MITFLRFLTLIFFCAPTFETIASSFSDLEGEEGGIASQKQGASELDLSSFDEKLKDPDFVTVLQERLKNFPQGVQKFYLPLFSKLSDPQKKDHFQAVYKAAEKKIPLLKKKLKHAVP